MESACKISVNSYRITISKIKGEMANSPIRDQVLFKQYLLLIIVISVKLVRQTNLTAFTTHSCFFEYSKNLHIRTENFRGQTEQVLIF